MTDETFYTEKDYPEKLVAFVDILGFKKLITQDKDKAIQSLNIIDSSIKHVLKILKVSYDKVFSTKLFSDCICLSCESTIDNAMYIMYELSYIQLYLAIRGIFLRGALSFGNHFENERMIFSSGLIKAYELEKCAKYPRIIVDKELVAQILDDKNTYFPSYIDFRKKDFLMKSPDGHYAVDYLNLIREEGYEQIEELQAHKKAILKNIHENINNVDIIEKYRWLSEYHNYKYHELFVAEGYEDNYAREIFMETTINMTSTFPQFKTMDNV